MNPLHPLNPFVVRPEEAEHIELPDGAGIRLLADAADTAGAVGVNLLKLAAGADGAGPHHHTRSTEVFYVVAGAARFLLSGADGDRAETVGAGGLVVVPPGIVHAFGAVPRQGAELLVLLTPGVDRFGYFRALGRVRRGEEPFDVLLDEQHRYDVHFAAGTAAGTTAGTTADDRTATAPAR
ncbi:cupin domain-containing protein [Streptomyces bambusae]|uniref:Cupin domain-containing protein n=1 Tax=Streptomyces bambusae TaxID=1550616 RepID=A0ABS6Z3C1_9ACTN|nr:cupin domain-containing protein [Streptomyces bambusae]MBW5482250.1 cupin domain-containing protein [Streptomyces bambusae]